MDNQTMTDKNIKICPNCGYIYFNDKCKKCGRKEKETKDE